MLILAAQTWLNPWSLKAAVSRVEIIEILRGYNCETRFISDTSHRLRTSAAVDVPAGIV